MLELGKPPWPHRSTKKALAFSSLHEPIARPVSSAHPKFPSAFSAPCLPSHCFAAHSSQLAGACRLVRRGRPSSTSDCEAHASNLSPGEVLIHSFSFIRVSVFTKLVGTWYPWYLYISLSAWHHTLFSAKRLAADVLSSKQKPALWWCQILHGVHTLGSQRFRKHRCWQKNPNV